MSKQVLSEEFQRMQRLAGINEIEVKEPIPGKLKQDILDFWDTLQDNAYQMAYDNGDDEYGVTWDTDFFIEQYPEYKGKEKTIDRLVKRYIDF